MELSLGDKDLNQALLLPEWLSAFQGSQKGSVPFASSALQEELVSGGSCTAFNAHQPQPPVQSAELLCFPSAFAERAPR